MLIILNLLKKKKKIVSSSTDFQSYFCVILYKI